MCICICLYTYTSVYSPYIQFSVNVGVYLYIYVLYNIYVYIYTYTYLHTDSEKESENMYMSHTYALIVYAEGLPVKTCLVRSKRALAISALKGQSCRCDFGVPRDHGSLANSCFRHRVLFRPLDTRYLLPTWY